MGGISYSHFFVLIARLVLTYFFVMAALPKIEEPLVFAGSVSAFRVIGPELSIWVALILPWLELVLGIGILLPLLKRSSGLLIALLLLIFIGLHTSAWLRGLEISCGCFGSDTSDEPTNYHREILRNTALLTACIFMIRYDWKGQRSSALDKHE